MAAVQVRKRLLFGSLAVSAVVSVAVGWAIAQNDSSGGTPSNGTRDTADVGIIETNAKNEGKPLPDVTVQDIDGHDIALSSLGDGPVIVNVWTSTCIPCKDELPDFAAAHTTYGDRVHFVGVDILGPIDTEESFARTLGVKYDLYYDGNGEFLVATGLNAFPVTLIIDNGVIIHQTGRLSAEQLDVYLQELLT